jgi:hypothetical protein
MDTVTRWLLRLGLACALCIGASACIGVSPEQKLANDLGPDTGPYDRGPLHRAGFPCTNCHGDLWWQDHPTFTLAGTVYRTPTDEGGSNGAQVLIEDANGQKITAQTNSVGNFFLMNTLVFPLRVSVKSGSVEQKMRGLIWRERSCANCHSKTLGVSSNGRVFAQEASP